MRRDGHPAQPIKMHRSQYALANGRAACRCVSHPRALCSLLCVEVVACWQEKRETEAFELEKSIRYKLQPTVLHISSLVISYLSC